MADTIVFIDGQNLYRSAKGAFGNGVPYPNFCAKKLSTFVAQAHGLNIKEIRFYTGVPDETKDPGWNYFWKNKKLAMERLQVKVFTRKLQYLMQEVNISHGGSYVAEIAKEKGIDVRIALDMVTAAVNKSCENMILFSQDQDLSEATNEVHKIASAQERKVRVICAFPVSPTTKNKRGVFNSEWFKFGWDQYKLCLDPNQYPKP